MNGGGMNLGGLSMDRAAPPIEKTQTVAKPVSDLPKEFGATTLFKPTPLFPEPQTAALEAAEPLAPAPELGSGGGNPNPLGSGLNPAMERGGENLLKLASSFFRSAGSRNSEAAAAPRGYEAARGSSNGNLIPNIRQLLPGARENFGVRQGDGSFPALKGLIANPRF